MARLELGPDIASLRVAAETAVNNHFAGSTLPLAIYASKTAEARRVLAGEESSLLTQEAALRGTTAPELANLVLGAAKTAEDRELARVALLLKLRAADAAGIRALLSANGLSLQP